jgi:hypothetical protein
MPNLIGSNANQISTNGMLGTAAFVDETNLVKNAGIQSPVNIAVNSASPAVTITQDGTGSALEVSGGVFGYGAGAGGAVTQATSKSTGVTLNKPSGQITMHSQEMVAGSSVEFTLTNSFFGASDGLVVNPNGFTGYAVEVAYFATTASVVLRVTNKGATRSDPLVIGFRIIKGATL